MGVCTSKPVPEPNFDNFSNGSNSRHNPGRSNPNQVEDKEGNSENQQEGKKAGRKFPFFPFYSPNLEHYLFSKKSPGRSSANSMRMKFFKLSFPPPSPAKHIKAVLAKRHGSVKPNEASILERNELESVTALDKSFGFSKHFGSKYELGGEVGREHFGCTCEAKFKKGDLKGRGVAIKVIPKLRIYFQWPGSKSTSRRWRA